MSANLSVDDQKKESLANEILAYHDELNRRIRSLNDVVDRVQTGWKGSAGLQYDTVQRDVNEHLRKISFRLNQLEEGMRMSIKGFNEEEQQRISEIRNVGSSEGGGSKILGMA